MGNEFISIKNIARQILPRLIENLVFPNLVHKDYSNDYVLGQGDTIQVKKPVILSASDFNASTGVVAQDVKEKSVEVKLDKLATVDVEFGAVAKATSVDDLNRLFVTPAAVALAEKINADGLALYKDIPYYTGTAGTTPSTLANIANAMQVLNENKVPLSMRRGVWNPTAQANFVQIAAIVNAEKSGTTQALREAEIGRIYGIDNYMAQGVKKATDGLTAATAVKVKGATTAGTTTTLEIDGTSLTGKLKAGDILVIDGFHYTVAEDSAAASTNVIAGIKVQQPIQSHADNADVTVVHGGVQNLVFHQNAFAFVTRPLAAPAGVESYTTSYNGITIRVTRGYDMTYKKEMLSADVLYGYKTMYPELACRVLG